MTSYSDPIHNLIYNNDASHIQTKSNVEVYIPKTKEDVKGIVSACVTHNRKIICRWGWTNLVGSCLPTEDAAIIDFSKLTLIRETGDGFYVEPGVTTDQLNEYLAPKKLYFPVVLWSHTAAEIGWMISTNWAWMRAVKYWKIWNWIEEIEFLRLNANKEIIIEKITGETLKNILWMEWTCWIILEAKIKVIAKPQELSASFFEFDDITANIEKVKQLLKQEDPYLSAMEIINPYVSKLLWRNEKYHLLVEYEKNNNWDIKDPEKIKKIWSKRDSCYSVVVNDWFIQIEDPEVEIDKQTELFDWFEKNNIPAYGHIWIGVIHPHFRPDQEWLMDEMYTLVQKLWWKVSWEHWIWIKKLKYISEETKNQQKSIKEKYDPSECFL